MPSKLVGSWMLVSSENFDEYMQAIGKRCHRLVWVVINRPHRTEVNIGVDLTEILGGGGWRDLHTLHYILFHTGCGSVGRYHQLCATVSTVKKYRGWLVGWLVDVFLLDDSWTPVPDAVGL